MIELALKQLDTSKKLESEQQDLELLELVSMAGYIFKR
jgi:hypothetical protein